MNNEDNQMLRTMVGLRRAHEELALESAAVGDASLAAGCELELELELATDAPVDAGADADADAGTGTEEAAATLAVGDATGGRAATCASGLSRLGTGTAAGAGGGGGTAAAAATTL